MLSTKQMEEQIDVIIKMRHMHAVLEFSDKDKLKNIHEIIDNVSDFLNSKKHDISIRFEFAKKFALLDFKNFEILGEYLKKNQKKEKNKKQKGKVA